MSIQAKRPPTSVTAELLLILYLQFRSDGREMIFDILVHTDRLSVL